MDPAPNQRQRAWTRLSLNGRRVMSLSRRTLQSYARFADFTSKGAPKLFPSGRRFAQDVKLGVGVLSQNTYTVRNGNRNFHKGEVRFAALSYPVYREARQEL
jgi:hypothetical protein